MQRRQLGQLHNKNHWHTGSESIYVEPLKIKTGQLHMISVVISKSENVGQIVTNAICRMGSQ